jgi:RNA polymerase sigma-70 factor (ECF subfamily)
VEDLVQDVFAVLVRTLPEFHYERGQRFRGWLWTVTVNKVRERGRRPRIARQAGDQELSNLVEADPAALIDDKEYAQFVARHAAHLVQVEFQPSTWKAFWEYVVADRPASVVARELGMTENAIYIAKGRVLRRLRRELDGLLH